MKLLTRISALSIMKAFVWGLAFALLFEVFTCISRFGLGLESTNDTQFLAPYTLGYRIHHGYIGGLMLLAALGIPGAWRNLLIVVGTGLVVSDLVHHFLVLWPVVGSPEFHIRYPSGPRPPT